MVELYCGDLLDALSLQEPPFEEWLMGERQRELAIETHAGRHLQKSRRPLRAADTGPSRVGKTRLVAELAAEADQGNPCVLIGPGPEREQILPFGPSVDALRAGDVPEEQRWFAKLPLTIQRESRGGIKAHVDATAP